MVTNILGVVDCDPGVDDTLAMFVSILLRFNIYLIVRKIDFLLYRHQSWRFWDTLYHTVRPQTHHHSFSALIVLSIGNTDREASV